LIYYQDNNIPDNNISLYINYEKIITISPYYTNLLPNELILIIINKSDYISLLNSYKSGIINIYNNEYNYKVLIKMYNERLYNDIINLLSTFTGFDKNWKNIYLGFRQYNIISLYNNQRPDTTYITETNWDKNDILNINSYILGKDNMTYLGLLLSFQLKNIMPIFYSKLISFHLIYTTDIYEFINSMISIYNLLYYNNEKFINSIINGYTSIRRFPSPKFDLTDYGQSGNHIKELCNSPILLWYYLNINNVSFDQYLDLDFIYYEIFNSLNKIIPPDEYMKKVGNNLIIYMYTILDPKLKDNTYKYVYNNLDKIYMYITKEKNIRGL
jgi:hypothetical protein